MNPPIFQSLVNDAAVRAALWWANATTAQGGPQLKVYQFGMAPEGVTDPYCTWRVQGGSPENYLGDRPDMDLFSVQFDVYGISAATVRAAAKALRDAMETKCHITAWLGESVDPETKRYRLTFSSDWWTPR